MAGRFSVEAIFQLKDRITGPVARITSRMQRMTRSATRGLKKMDRAFSKVGKSVRRAGVAIGGGILAIGFALRGLGKSGLEFEQAITDVGAVSLKTREDIAALEEAALSLGSTTKFTATEAANAMEVMARAGFTNTQILAGIDGVLAGAAASGEELATVAGIVSDALKGMGLEADQSNRVVDVLALASSRTKSTMGSLGESLKNVASTARELGIPLEQTVAAVALLQDVGLDASVAGSAMNTMLTKLAKPPAAVAKQMKKFGISFKDAKGDMLPFQDVIQNISEAAKRSGGNLDRVAFLADLVGLRGQKAASNLATLFETGKLQELVTELGNAEGAAKKMAEIRLDTLGGDLTLLESAVDGVKVSLFNLEGGPLRGVVQGMTKWIEANKELIQTRVGEFIKTVSDNSAEIIENLRLLGRAVAVFFVMSAAVKVLNTAMAIYNGLVKVATGLMWLYGASVKGAKIVMGLFTTQTRAAAGAQLLLGLETQKTSTGFAGLRKGLNASKLGGAINGITGKLGKAGLLGAVLAVSFGITSWLDSKFKISDMISGWFAQITGLQAEIDKTGKRVVGGDASTRLGGGPPTVKPPPVPAPIASEIPQLPVEEIMTKLRLTSLPEDASEAGGQDAPETSLITPEERISRSISETISTERQTSEITIRDDTGRAEVTRQSGGGAPLRLQSTGAF